jgi:hypothetical protein
MSDHEQAQTVNKCAEFREAMQNKIYERMENQHTAQMEVLGNIKEEIAFRKGREEALVKNALTQYHNNGGNGNGKIKSSGKDILVKILIAWGPWIILLLFLGSVSILKAKGYL